MLKYLLLMGAAAGALSSAAHAELVISNDPTANVSCSAGVCSATAADAVLNEGDLATLLSSGDVTVNTGGATAGDIALVAPFTWTGPSALTLDAYHSVLFKAVMTVPAKTQLAVRTNDGGSLGGLRFHAGGKIDLPNNSSGLSIDGAGYHLVDSIRQLVVFVLRHPAAHIALTADYDAKPDGIYATAPVSASFFGTFNGLGHTIDHLLVSDSSDDSVGFFGTLQSGAVVTGLALRHAAIAGSSFVGGIAGESSGTIDHVLYDGVVRGPYVGGIVGHNLGTVNGAQVYGRMLGSDAGGIAAWNQGAIVQSFSASEIKWAPPQLDNDLGGLVGLNSGGDSEPGTILDSYAIGKVVSNKVTTSRGGLAGFNPTYSLIQTSYSTSQIKEGGGGYVGGFVGATSHPSKRCYWDVTTSGRKQGAGRGNDDGIKGLTDDELKAALPAGFDPNIWGQNAGINNGYPYLIDNPPE